MLKAVWLQLIDVFVYVVYADSSQDHAIIDLLAGLEDDGFCRTPVRQNSQSQLLPGARSYHCNSDEEEAGPELDKEEAELSVIMSQRWDNGPPQNSALTRQVCLCPIWVICSVFVQSYLQWKQFLNTWMQNIKWKTDKSVLSDETVRQGKAYKLPSNWNIFVKIVLFIQNFTLEKCLCYTFEKYVFFC